jgi:small-conductance mechanosensitive channel
MNVIRQIFLLLLAIVFLCAGFGAPAWATAKEEKKPAEATTTLPAQDVKALSALLKDDTQRKAFLEHLDTLLKIKQEQDNALAQPLSETIGLKNYTENLFEDYQKFLKKYDLSSTMMGKMGLSVGILIVALVAFFIVHKACKKLQQALGRFRRRFGIEGARFGFYVRVVRLTGYLIVFFMGLYALAWNWDVKALDFVKSDRTFELLNGLLNVVTICAVGVILWEALNGLIEMAIRRADHRGESRVRTLLPLLRHILFIAFGGLFLLILLSEFGINIMPLLAGAGILGIAVGFGAQTMVKDFLTGFTIILEDLIQVGDVVRLAGHSGVVERITIRKVQLRDQSGIVYTVPFSEITTVENLTKDFSYYVMNVSTAYNEDPDRVMAVLRAVDEDLRADPEVGPFVLEPIEIMGVDQFGESAVVIKARIKTKPSKQWPVGRAFNRRMKLAFDREGIEIPFPHRTVYFRNEAQGAPSGPQAPGALAAGA